MIDKNHLSQFQEETWTLFYQRVYAILLIGIVIVPLFAVLDYFIAREYFGLFFAYRIVCSISCLGLLLIYFQPVGRNYPFIIAITGYILAGITVSLMVVQLGGYDSYYYVGILMVLVTFSAILPLNAFQSALSSVLLYLIYAVPIFIFNEATPEKLRVFLSNSFFFLFFIVIAAIQCREETEGRIREFNLKMDLKGLAERLSYYSQNLEIEVDKRAKALAESELRYQDLYENIIDMVILLSNTGKLLMANPRFYRTVGLPMDPEANVTLQNFVHEDELAVVKDTILVNLSAHNDLKDYQFRVINQNGDIVDVECNARCIQRETNLIGFQLVMRDITRRKKIEQQLLESHRKVQIARTATILGLAKLAEYRDQDTGYHLERIREYVKIMARELASKPDYKHYITKEYLDNIYLSSILHDIGKVGIPDAILLKPGKLSPEEFEIIKTHSILGGNAIRAIESKIEGKSFLTLGKEIAYYHHEKWDGSGYPEGLKGEAIPLSARIVALADVYDALTSKRSYKAAFSHEKALEIIVEQKGGNFAPDAVDAFLTHERQFNTIRCKMHDVDKG